MTADPVMDLDSQRNSVLAGMFLFELGARRAQRAARAH